MNYFTDGRTCWVKVGVTIDGLEHVEMLPVMNFKNQSIPLDKVTSCDANKAIQRAFRKILSGIHIQPKTVSTNSFGDRLSQVQNAAQPAQAQPVNKPVEVAPQAPAQQKPVKDTRPVTQQMFDKEKREHLVNVVNNADMKTQQPPKQETETEGEEITLDLSNAEMEALAECAKVFS